MSSYDVTIEVTPERSLFDEVVDIVVSGLSPYSHVTLVCRVKQNDTDFFSTAIYRSDDKGTVDVSKMSALDGGSYDGLEPMGLFWSLIQEPGQKPGRRFITYDARKPMTNKLYVLLGMLEAKQCLEYIAGDQVLARKTIERIYMADGVQRTEVRQGRLVATLFMPAGQGPFPGVIEMGGVVGGVIEDKSALLASRGIASLAVGYFKVGKDKSTFTDVEYFKEAIEYLTSQEKIIKPYIGVVGICVGGTIALVLSTLCPQISACVNISGSSYLSYAELTYAGRVIPRKLPIIDKIAQTETGFVYGPGFWSVSPEDREQYSVPVEVACCDYLLLFGEDDQNMTPDAGNYIAARLRRHGKNNFKLINYPGAGHLLQVPYTPHMYATYHADYKDCVVWGGRRRAHAKAQDDGWSQTLNFIKSKLGKQENYTTENSLKSQL